MQAEANPINMKESSHIKKRVKSFAYAGKGIASFVCKEHNAWIHSIAIIAVTAAGFYFDITKTEWIAVTLCFGLVLSAEAFNSAIERVVDLASPDIHPLAGDAKDIAAGAVLICAIATAIVGGIIFIPYIFG